MGYYSFTCAKTGLPIASGDCGCEPKFYRVVVLERCGGITRGDYDGYGRVGGGDADGTDTLGTIGAPGGPKMVLAHFYRGESYEQLGDSGHDPDQGAYDPDFWPVMYRAQEEVQDFDGRQYEKRLTERTRLRGQMAVFMDRKQGVETHQLYTLQYALQHAHVQEPSRAVRDVDDAWRKLLDGVPGGAFPPGHPAHGLAPEAAYAVLDGQRQMLVAHITQEVMCAWTERRAARVPDFEALLGGDIAAGWRKPAEPDRSAAPRMRM